MGWLYRYQHRHPSEFSKRKGHKEDFVFSGRGIGGRTIELKTRGGGGQINSHRRTHKYRPVDLHVPCLAAFTNFKSIQVSQSFYKIHVIRYMYLSQSQNLILLNHGRSDLIVPRIGIREPIRCEPVCVEDNVLGLGILVICLDAILPPRATLLLQSTPR